MYESPIEKIYGDIQSRITKQYEENIMYHVEQAVGYKIDKQRIIKALNYDSEQYKKGYEDGLKESKWIPVSERLPEDDYVRVLITVNGCRGLRVRSGTYYKNGSFHSDMGDFWTEKDNGVIAWMPLPEPYKAERNVR